VIKQVKLIDVQTPDFPVRFKNLLFTMEDLQGNDLIYDISIYVENAHHIEELEDEDFAFVPRLTHEWARQWRDAEPPSLKETYVEFLRWIKEQGVLESETLLAKIWW
jgi:hypothetical protein